MCLNRPLQVWVLAATARHSAHYPWYGEVNAITCAPRAANLNVDCSAAGRPDNFRLFASSDLLGVHLKGPLFVDGPGQLGYVLPLIPGDEARQTVVRSNGNVPI